MLHLLLALPVARAAPSAVYKGFGQASLCETARRAVVKRRIDLFIRVVVHDVVACFMFRMLAQTTLPQLPNSSSESTVGTNVYVGTMGEVCDVYLGDEMPSVYSRRVARRAKRQKKGFGQVHLPALDQSNRYADLFLDEEKLNKDGKNIFVVHDFSSLRLLLPCLGRPLSR